MTALATTVPASAPRSTVAATVATITAPPSEEAGLGRAIVVGASLGLVLGTGGVTAAALAIGEELASALGLGLFVGFWGGSGFGFMLGAALHVLRHADH